MFKIKLLDKKAKFPIKATKYSSGYDLYSIENIFIPVGSTVKIRTGISIYFDNNYVLKIEDRSSLALKGLRTGAGVIDPDYFPGEIQIVMHNLNNTSEKYKGKSGYWIKEGDRIAQFLIYEVKNYEPILWGENDTYNKTDRIGGFGSTGK